MKGDYEVNQVSEENQSHCFQTPWTHQCVWAANATQQLSIGSESIYIHLGKLCEADGLSGGWEDSFFFNKHRVLTLYRYCTKDMAISTHLIFTAAQQGSYYLSFIN